jgi:hypothetical protein
MKFCENPDELFRVIHEIGYRGEYYRFDLILPKEIVGRGRSFDNFGGKEVVQNENDSWYRDDCLIPMEFVGAAEYVKKYITDVRISFLIDVKDIGDFVKALSNALKKTVFRVYVEEIINGDASTVSRETQALNVG